MFASRSAIESENSAKAGSSASRGWPVVECWEAPWLGVVVEARREVREAARRGVVGCRDREVDRCLLWREGGAEVGVVETCIACRVFCVLGMRVDCLFNGEEAQSCCLLPPRDSDGGAERASEAPKQKFVMTQERHAHHGIHLASWMFLGCPAVWSRKLDDDDFQPIDFNNLATMTAGDIH